MALHWQVGDRIQGRWEIHKILRGGMGIVYVVYDHELHEVSAAKTFQDEVFERHPESADRFRREALTWLKLGVHQNVTEARILEVIQGKPYLFLEYVGGGSLRSWIGTPRLTDDLSRVLVFALQFCDGMTHALANGIRAHRDIKPDNCLITQDGVLKVTDFGLARVLDANGESLRGFTKSGSRGPIWQSQTGVGAGTFAYMAPEQFEDAKHVDVRADVYSFGVMLFEMLTGELPFAGLSPEEFYWLHKTGVAPRLAGTGEMLNTIVQSCLAKNPGRRFPDFSAVRQLTADLYERLTGCNAPEAAVGAELNALQNNYKAVSLAALGRPEEAISLFDRAIELAPWLEINWVNKGNLLSELGHNDDALACYDRALQLDPNSALALTNKGALLQQLGRGTEAITLLDHALKLNPGAEAAWINKGCALSAMGRYDEALGCQEMALKLNPDSEHAWFNKGNALFAMGRPEEALLCFDRNLQLNPRLERAWVNKANALGALGKYEEARACYERALKLSPGLALAWSNMGKALCNERRFEDALVCFDRALEIEPHNVTMIGLKGTTLAELRRYPEALACFEEGRRLGDPRADKAIRFARSKIESR